MSGPKYIEFDVNCSEEERLEIIKTLNDACRYGANNGVSCRGSNNLTIRVGNYSNLSVAKVKELVAMAKAKVAEENERRRREELKQAKEAENARIDAAIQEIDASADKQIKMIDSAINECERKISALKEESTDTQILSNVSAEGLADSLSGRVDALRQTKAAIIQQKEARKAEFEKHRNRVNGFSNIEDLNQAIISSPSTQLPYMYDANIKREILQEIKNCESIFASFREYLGRLEDDLNDRSEASRLIGSLNAVLEEHPLNTIDDIQACIEMLKKQYQIYAAEQRTEEMGRIATFIEELEESVKKIKVSVGGAVPIGPGIDRAKEIDEGIATSRKIVGQIKELEYIAPNKQKKLSELTATLDILSGEGKDAVTQAQVQKCKRELEQLEAACKRDEKKYQEFKRLQTRLDKLKKRAQTIGLDSVEIRFKPDCADQCIRDVQEEIDRLEHDLSIVERDGRAVELISSLVNKENGSAGTYEVLSDEEIDGERRCIRFTKPGCFGVVYEYIIEPGGNVRRDVRGVKMGGQAIIGKEALVEKKKTDCADIGFLEKDMEAMGAKTQVTELQTAEESSKLDGYLELDENLEERYLAQALTEEEQEYSDQFVERAKEGETYQEIKESIEEEMSTRRTSAEDDDANEKVLYADA